MRLQLQLLLHDKEDNAQIASAAALERKKTGNLRLMSSVYSGTSAARKSRTPNVKMGNSPSRMKTLSRRRIRSTLLDVREHDGLGRTGYPRNSESN